MIDVQINTFPVDAYLPKIVASLQEYRALIIKASPGAGKTTRVPMVLRTLGQRIMMVQPRRVAARLSAEWMAQTLGEPVGQTIGYQVRFESQQSLNTEVLVVTEGLLTRKLLQSSLLDDYGIIILDEFHERHIHSDLALSFVKEIMVKRKDLKLVVMSATLDTAYLESFLPSVAVFDIPGQVFPVSVEYHPMDQPNSDWELHIAKKIAEMAHDVRCQGHILAFLTGAKEIRRVAEKLRNVGHTREILILTSESATAFFHRFKQLSAYVTILATNVAETSVTLPGIRGIIDGGNCKMAGFAPWNGLPTLEVQKISKASCIQRTGRAGRTAPGICYRLFDEHDYRSRLEYTPSEIRRVDLCQTLLESTVIKEKLGISEIPWFEKPRESQIEGSLALLRSLGATFEDGRLTKDGFQMAKWPLHPRLSRMILDGQSLGINEAALLGALLLNEGTFRINSNAGLFNLPNDLFGQVKMLAEHPRKFEKADPAKTGRIFKLYDSYQHLCRAGSIKKILECNEKDFQKLAFRSFADRVAKLRGIENEGKKDERAVYHFCSGNEGSFQRTSFSNELSDWIVALEAELTKDGLNDTRKIKIMTSIAVDAAWLLEDPFKLRSEQTIKALREGGERPTIRTVTSYGGLVLAETVRDDSDSATTHEVLLEYVKRDWAQIFHHLEDLKKYHQKINILDSLSFKHQMPHFEGEYLQLLQDAVVDGCKSRSEVMNRKLKDVIYGLLRYEDTAQLDNMFPDYFVLENGKKLKIYYSEKEDPYIESKIQDFFGQKSNPHICQGRWALVIKLLAPNFRPAQITKDLNNFWTSSYESVRKELRARYPRHPWPEKPGEYIENKKNIESSKKNKN